MEVNIFPVNKEAGCLSRAQANLHVLAPKPLTPAEGDG